MCDNERERDEGNSMSGTNASAQQAAGPHFEHHQCLEVACTECGEQFGEDAALHFPSIAQALTAIAGSGWEIADNAVLCYDCIDQPDHAASAPAVLYKCEYCWPPLFSDAPMPPKCQCARTNIAVAHVQIPFIIWTLFAPLSACRDPKSVC
jgi:hypothetical protein